MWNHSFVWFNVSTWIFNIHQNQIHIIYKINSFTVRSQFSNAETVLIELMKRWGDQSNDSAERTDYWEESQQVLTCQTCASQSEQRYRTHSASNQLKGTSKHSNQTSLMINNLLLWKLSLKQLLSRTPFCGAKCILVWIQTTFMAFHDVVINF